MKERCLPAQARRSIARRLHGLVNSSAPTNYLEPSNAGFMLNYIVEDLDERTEEYDYGKFGWLADPEATRLSCGN